MQASDIHAPHSIDSRAKMREEIDAELAILYNRVHILHAKRNTLSALYRLPPEILVRIFLEYQSTFRDNTDIGSHDPKKYAAWIRVSQLTQYLRGLVLGSPELWSNIIVTDRRWVSKFIELSRSNHLCVELQVKNKPDVQLFRQVLDQSERISTLDILIDHSLFYTALEGQVLRKPAPCLKALRLQISFGWDDDDSLFSIPIDIFSQIHPNLKHLYLNFWLPNLKAPLFTQTNLTDLTIISPGTLFPIYDVLRLMQGLPTLHSLDLRHALSGGIVHPVHLSNLGSLRLEDSKLTIHKDFLASIIIPASTAIYLDSSIESETQDLVDNVLDWVKRGTGQTSLIFEDIKVYRSMCQLTMVFMKSPRRLSRPFLTLEFSFGRELPPEGRQEFVGGLPNWLLPSVETLQLQGSMIPASPQFWCCLSRVAPRIRHLILGFLPTQSFVEYLRLDGSGSLSADERLGADPEDVYPALRKLTVRQPSHECLLALCHALEIRKRQGMKALDELSLRQFGRGDAGEVEQIELVLQDKAEMVRWMGPREATELYDSER